MNALLKFITEKIILGLVENIELDGLGNVTAKVDSGNDLYNVIHGENISYKPNGTVTFTTIGGQTIEKRLNGRITVNVGACTTEERPVILFDIKIKGKNYKDIPFSVGNRRDNEEKVLLGVDFLSILDCLIDPEEN